MLQVTEIESFTEALKSIARRPDIKAYIEENPILYRLLRRAALQYVTGDTRDEGLGAAIQLNEKGYLVSLEYIGENTMNVADCIAATAEMSALIEDLGAQGIPARVSFDLSHIGLSLNPELA